MVDDGPGAVEALVDVDAGFSVAPAIGKDLEDVRSEGDGVVIGDDAPVLEAEDGLGGQVLGPGPIGELRPDSGSSETRIVAAEESREEGIRRVLVGDAGQAEFGHEAVLEGTEDALDAALRLGAGRGHPADAQVLQEASDLSGSAHTLELFFDAPAAAAGAAEDPVAIGVSSQGKTGTQGELPEDLEVTGGGLLIVEPAGEDLACGVVDGGMEDEPRAAILEPGMMAAVELDEHAFLGHALAAGAVLGRAPATRAGDAGLLQEAADGLARDLKSFPLA